MFSFSLIRNQYFIIALQLELSFIREGNVVILVYSFASSHWLISIFSLQDMVIHNRPLSYLVLRLHFETMERELVAKFDLLGVSDSTQYQQLLSGILDFLLSLFVLHFS